MTEQKTIPLLVVSLQSVKPKTAFGQLATFPMFGEAQALARAVLTQIPPTAVITSAEVRFTQHTAWAGSKALTLRRNTAPGVATSRTWDTAPPATATGAVSQTRSSPAAGSLWQLGGSAMVDMVQGWVSGTFENYGMTLLSASSTKGVLRGSKAASGVPVLVVEYTTEPTTPTALHPAGGLAVSLAKPTLTAQVAADTVSTQWQVDAAADAVSPDFDSGEKPGRDGLLNLNTTAYPGLADGATTKFRVRAKNPQGWSSWSPWATFSRTTWETLALTSPGATSEDPSPTVTATYAGTVTAWRGFTKNAAAELVDDSGWEPGDDMAFGSTKAVGPIGATGTAFMSIRDDVLRAATPGDPDYRTVSLDFTVAPSGVPEPIAGIAVSQTWPRPVPTLTGARDAIPDEVVVYRNGEQAVRVPGADVFTGAGPYALSVDDITAPMNVPAVYVLYAITNGEWSDPSDAVTITPTGAGVWIIDTEDGTEAVLWGDGDAEQAQTEVAIVHTPISGPGGEPQVVRRRLARYPRSGAFPEGSALMDVVIGNMTLLAADSEANLRRWAEQDAGHLYRYAMGNQNDQVILGDLDFGEVAINRRGLRVLAVGGNWWRQDKRP